MALLIIFLATVLVLNLNKKKQTNKTRNNGTKDVKVMVTLYYLSNFWRTIEIPLINCEINPSLAWSKNCVISNAAANQDTTFEITDAKLYVPVVTLSTDDNGKPLQQLNQN